MLTTQQPANTELPFGVADEIHQFVGVEIRVKNVLLTSCMFVSQGVKIHRPATKMAQIPAVVLRRKGSGT